MPSKNPKTPEEIRIAKHIGLIAGGTGELQYSFQCAVTVTVQFYIKYHPSIWVGTCSHGS